MQLHRASTKNTGNSAITAGRANRGRLALLFASFLISYLAAQTGHAQTTASGDQADDQVRNLRQVASVTENSAQGNDHQSAPRPLATGVITINPAITHQTMRGWEVVAQADQFRPDYAAYQSAVLDKVVEAGIDRIRLEVRAGSENSRDSFAEWVAAGVPGTGTAYQTWRARRYEIVNDNSDPNVANPAGFHWTELDDSVTRIVNPLRARMAAKGESLYVQLTDVAFQGQVTSGAPNVHQTPAEYAEFMLEAFKHMQSTYGWVPDAINVILEPDNTINWGGALLGQVIAATGTRLAAAGFTPDFIGPSTTNMSTASTWFDQLWAVTAARPFLKELGYHRYAGVNTTALQAIASKAQAAGIGTAMLEWWDVGNTFNTMHEDLKVGRNSAWQQATIVNFGGPASLAISYVDPATPSVATFSNTTKFTQQYFRHVRRGAVRVDASTSNGTFDPLAFRNPSGKYTVVVKAGASGSLSIDGLPSGTYGIYYTASSAGSAVDPDLYAVSKPDQTISAGQTLTTDIPAYGLITIYGKTGGSALPIAANDVHATLYNTPLTVAAPGVLGNDNANGGGSMTAALQAAASSGTVVLNANGSFVYTPATGFSGAATFTYRASTAGGLSNVATVTVNVAAAKLPIAANDTYATASNTPLTVAAPGVLSNDNANGGGALSAAVVTGASSGAIAMNANGGFVYTPASGFSGAATFSYRASTVNGQSNVATVTINVASGTGVPTAANDSYSTSFNTPLTVAASGIMSNDNPNGGGAMTAVQFTSVTSGSVNLKGNGGFTYAPATGFSGVASFKYLVTNATGYSNVATVTVNVSASDVPTAAGDTYVTTVNTPLTVNAPGVLGNDIANGAMTAVQQSPATSGVATLNANGSFTYAPVTGFTGVATFTYRAATVKGQGNLATVTINVAPATTPTAVDDAYMAVVNLPLTVAAPGVLGNDIANGGTITAVSQAAASNGTVALNANGSFTYTPTRGYTGPVTFTYRASNSTGRSDAATVTINVAKSGPPAAVDDSYATAFDAPLRVQAPGVLSNDNGWGGSPFTATLVSPTTNGTLSLSASGSFIYTPTGGFSGIDRFTYRGSNAAGKGATATVTIEVAGPGEPLPPTSVRVTSIADGRVTFGWVPPQSGPQVTGYQIEGGLKPGEVLGVMPVGPAPLATVEWPRGSFYLRVRTLAGGVTSKASNEVLAHVNVPMPPSAPAHLLGTVVGDTFNLAWTNTHLGGRLDSVTLNVAGAMNTSVPLGLTDTFRFPGVPQGTYTFTVQAVNASGASVASNPVTLTFPTQCSEAPVPVANFVAYQVGGVLSLTWDPPAIGGAPTDYVLNVTGAYHGRVPTQLRTVSGPVPPGSYTFDVVATNACGTSPRSQAHTVVVP